MIAHGKDGWELVQFGWDRDTGTSKFVYERNDETSEVTLQQPKWVLTPEERSGLA